jgi:undecaprenyl-diphosphatase
VACLPAVACIPFNDQIDALFYNYRTVAIALIVYGVLFIVIENRNKHRRPAVDSFQELTYKMALFIGIFQVLALIPGTSRSGATILGAILLGTSRYIAAEFTFFLAIPVMFGASAIKLLDFGFDFTGEELIILAVGMITAFIVSIIAIKFLMGYIKKHDFKAFGWYRIVLGVVVLGYFFIKNGTL